MGQPGKPRSALDFAEPHCARLEKDVASFVLYMSREGLLYGYEQILPSPPNLYCLKYDMCPSLPSIDPF